jgi:exodeoxyribonuclease III
MAFRKKAALILAHQPDILVVPECECPDNLRFNAETIKPTDILWFGKNKHKGLGIFSYRDHRFEVLDDHDPELQTIVPIAVTGGEFEFNLFAIWANNPNDPDGQYVEQVWKAIHYYDQLLISKPAILTGDFNSNTIWDRPRRAGNHSNVVKYLEERGVVSTYHLHHQQTQGEEEHPTFYLYRHKDKPYHLDYCFVSSTIAEKVQSVEIGDHAYWTQYSDHVPVMITLK